MKQLLSYRPLFNPTAKTLDFTQYPGGFSVNRLYAVINVTQNVPIYIAGATGTGITSVTGSVVTLAYDTSTHGTNDILNVYYDTSPGYEDGRPVERGGQLQMMQESLNQLLVEMKLTNIILAQGFNMYKDDLEALRADVDAVNTNINK